MGRKLDRDDPQACSCGSGLHYEERYDARGYYLCRVCPACKADRLRGYRPEVLTDPNYEADEDFDGEDDGND